MNARSLLFVLPALLVACGGSIAASSGDDSGAAADTGSTTSDGGSSSDGGGPLRCGGKAGVTCPADMWCQYAIGTCHNPDEEGTCVDRVAPPCPAPDPSGADAVCGCNFNTYASACEAAAAAESIERLGGCPHPTPTPPCGGSAGTPCPAGRFCDFGAKCPAPGSEGTCTTIPSGCPDIYAPVCGCDGVTYGNDCDAQAHGQTIASKGACAPSSAKTCGGIAGLTCASDEYCDYGIPSACGGDDGTGTCQKRPTSCVPSDGAWCGCDGKTHESPCDAEKSGYGVRHAGPCP